MDNRDDGIFAPLIENSGMTAKQAGDFYVQRANVETDIENIKVRLRGEKLNGKCADVVQKELAVIVCTTSCSSRGSRETWRPPPRKLSFPETRECVRNDFERSAGRAKRTVRAHFVTALKLAAKCRIADGPGRSFKRECCHKRPRCDNFPGRQSAGDRSQQATRSRPAWAASSAE